MERAAPLAQLDAATVRALAVEADVDPRTLRKVASGLPVRGMAGRRALKALLTAGHVRQSAAERPGACGSAEPDVAQGTVVS